MATELRQSTARTVLIGPFLDSTNGIDTEETLTINQANVLLSKNAGSLAQKNDTGGGTHDDEGYYTVDLNATDTDTLGTIRLVCHMAGATRVWEDFLVINQEEYDAKYTTGVRPRVSVVGRE